MHHVSLAAHRTPDRKTPHESPSLTLPGRLAGCLVACALLVLAATSSKAATISSHVTQSGGTYMVGPPNQNLIIDAAQANDARLTLENGATTEGINALTVGNAEHGVLDVRSGSILSTTAVGNPPANISATIGSGSNATGVATVTGDGSLWTGNHNLNIGSLGVGTLNIEAGGAVEAIFGYIGNGGNGTLNVTGAGSTWTTSSRIRVGNSSVGTLNIEDGGVVNSGNRGHIGEREGSTGMAIVNGDGSTWNTTLEFDVGLKGNGTLTVEEGGLVSNGTGFIGNQSGSSGTATVTGDGSQWTNSGSLYVGGSAAAAGGVGTLNILDEGIVTVGGSLTVWETGTIGGDGTIQGDVVLHGLVSPGNSPGTMSVDGGLTLAGGATYQFEVADATGGAGSGWDLLSITEDTLITATANDPIVLQLVSLDGALPGSADNFSYKKDYLWELLTSDSISGFDPALFALDTLIFESENDISSGRFELVQSGNSLALQFHGVPEPSTLVLLAGLAAVALLARRKSTGNSPALRS